MAKNTEKQCPIFYAFNHRGELCPVSCGQWSCEQCAKKLAGKWAWRTRLEVATWKRPGYMLTLTVRGYIKDVEYAYKMLPKWFDTFRKTMQRNTHGKWFYIAFVEGQYKTRDGMPHFHIISRKKPEIREHVMDGKKWAKNEDGTYKYRIVRFKDLAWRCGFGFEADLQTVSDSKAAYYVSKYASKIDPLTPKGFRRVRTSEGWHELPEFEGEGLIIKKQGESITEYLLRVHELTGLSLDALYDKIQENPEWRS